jgi:hypothetical protein
MEAKIMVEYNFDEEMDLLAEKIPGFYEDSAARKIALPYRVTWFGIRMRACNEIFGVDSVPKIATEEHIQMVKDVMRRIIAEFPDPVEETEPEE